MTQHEPTTILLIEDSPSDTRLIKESLRDAPHERFSVVTASTLAKGLRKLERDTIDAVLLDLSLPDSEGIDTFHAVRKLKPSLPIVVLTMTDDDALGVRMVHEGAQDYLPKTVLTQETCTAALTRAIRYAVERKRADEQMEALNERLQIANEELYALNQELRYGVQERTEQLNTSNEELRATNVELRREIEHRTTAEQTARTHAHQQEILTHVIAAGNSATSLQSALVAMLDTALDLLNLDNGGIFLRDGDTMTLQYERGYTAEQRAWTQRIPITQRRIARIMEGTPWISDGYQADVTPEVREMNKDVASMATVPLMAGNAVVGFYQLVSLRRPHHFTDEERALLVSIGQEAGTVITRLLAEQALKQSEARLNKLLEQSFDAVFIHSDGIVRFANGVAARILKAARPEDLVGLDALAFPTDEFRELVKERIALIYDSHAKTEPVEMQFKTFDGGVVDVESMATDTVWGGKPAVYVAFRDITEKKRAEKELKRYAERLEDLVEERTAQLAQSEEEFRTLFEESGVGQIRYDADSYPVRMNKAAAKLLGVGGVDDINHITIFSNPNVSEEDKARLRAGQPVRHEHRYDFPAIRESGYYQTTRLDVAYFDVYILPLLSASGTTVGGYLSQYVDITERMEAEEAQKASEEQYRTLVETANSLIFTLDNEGIITYVNAFGARSLGYTPDELIGHNVMIIVPDTDSSGRDMTPYINDIVARPDEHTVSINENVTKDGRRLWFNWVNKILTDEEGHHIGHLAIGNEVTEQLRIQQALRDSEERYRTLVETAHSIILTVDNHGIITFINDYGAHFFGYTPDELVGRHTMILVPPVESTGRDLTAHIDDVIAHPDQHSMSLNENITRDGRRVLINWVNHLLTDREGHHIGHLTMGYDVTEQKRAEDALRDAQRLAGIGQTAAMIGHDLRNPLQGLQYIVDLQKLRFERIPPDKRSVEDWKKEQELFDRISEQVFYMDKIVGDLQDYARPITPEHEEITIRAIIDDVLESLPPSDWIHTVIDVSDLTFVADPHLMLRVLSNLILNAMQAMPDGGTLTIDAEATDGSIAIHVSDTGVGVPVEMRDKIFSPLTTGKAKGTGLGLAVVKRIVEAHGGTITFESEEGGGTTFTVTLPQTAE